MPQDASIHTRVTLRGTSKFGQAQDEGAKLQPAAMKNLYRV
jgi:hypothetical protein